MSLSLVSSHFGPWDHLPFMVNMFAKISLLWGTIMNLYDLCMLVKGENWLA